MKKHFVTFYSPGTLVHETSELPIASWSVTTAVKMARKITERHGATPFGFQFSTRTRGTKDLDSKVSKESKMYYLGGTILTAKDIEARNDPEKYSILLSNMRCNGWNQVIENCNSWKIVQPFNKGDTLLQFDPPKRKAA